MPAAWSLTPPYFLALGFLSGVVGFRVGWRTRGRFGLPLAEGLSGWGAFLLAWTILGPAWAAAAAGAWAVGTSLVSVYEFARRPEETDARVLRAVAYRRRMLESLASGRGPESRPGATTLLHLRELIYYLAAAILTANLASLVMGAVLLNFMNAYVATLLRAATRTGRVAALSWPVWSVVRVGAYVALGTAAASPLLSRFGWGRDGAVGPLAIAGGAGVVLDLLLKLALSRRYGAWLAPALDLSAAAENRSAERPLRLGLGPEA